jgi:hypothetical protein
MMAPRAANIHASAVSVHGQGVIFTGPSGSGKSDLALRLIDRGAVLISDDRVVIEYDAGVPVLFPAPNIAGLIELRGVGIIAMPCASAVPLILHVNLSAHPERTAGPIPLSNIAGFSVKQLALSAFEASAAIKVELALESIVDPAAQAVARHASGTEPT